MIKANKVAPGVYLPYWHTKNQESRRRKEYAYLGDRNLKLEIMVNARLACRLILMITAFLFSLKKKEKKQNFCCR